MKNLRIKNNTTERADLFIYGDIVDDGWKWFESDVTPDDVLRELELLRGKTLHVYINSNGGDVFAGTAIHNMLRRHDGHVVGHVDGVAASIASVILMACDEIVVPSNAYVMIHQPSVGVRGTANDLLKMAEVLETIECGIVETYKLHSDLEDGVLREKMAAETWLRGEDLAGVFNVGVKVVAPLQAVACATALGHRLPEAVMTADMVAGMEIDIALALAE